MSEADLPRHPKICDLGCGAGWSTGILGVFGPALGVDLSDVAPARIRYPHCEFTSQNVIEWDGPKGEFDLVVSLEVIEHIEQQDQSRYVAVASRLLKLNGYLIITTPNKRTMEAIPGGGRTWSNQPIENWLDPAALRSLVRSNGFQIERLTSVCLGVASLGAYRLVNSHKLARCMRSLGLFGIWQRAALSAHYGIHLALLAKKTS
jgi:2-polyprenyl-3-methyl-5-hydroxy-6-metoxy-1,4-benzoquinol methylase